MWLFEEPLYVIILGVIAVAMLGFAWYQVQWRSLLYAIAGVVVLTVVMLVIGHFVVTDTEQVKQTLYDLAHVVEQNDLNKVLEYAATGADDVRAQAAAELPRYDIHRVKIKHNLEVTIDYDKTPPRATATFNVVVEGVERSLHASFHVPRYVEMTFVKQNGKWRVLSYHHWSPEQSMKLKLPSNISLPK